MRMRASPGDTSNTTGTSSRRGGGGGINTILRPPWAWKDWAIRITVALLLVLLMFQYKELARLKAATSTTTTNNEIIDVNGWIDDDGLEDIPNSSSTSSSSSSNSLPTPPDIAAVTDDEVVVDKQQLDKKDEKTSEAIQLTLPTKPKSTVTILTGTHRSLELERLIPASQDPLCSELAMNLHGLWSAWEIFRYIKYKTLLRASIKRLVDKSVSCTLAGWGPMMWTFPMTWNTACDARTNKMLQTKSYIREETKVYVNWALIRPDLVTFHNLALVEGMEPRFLVTIGRDFASAAFSKEACPRFNVMLDKRDVYKQRLLLVVLSDIQHQLGRLRRNAWITSICDDAMAKLPSNNVPGSSSSSTSIVSAFLSRQQDFKCALAKSTSPLDKNHMGSMSMMRLFTLEEKNWQPLPKTIFTGPKLIFVAGLEGVGHHVFAILGKKHTTRAMYEALTDHLCDSSWDDESATKYVTARARMVQAMTQIRRDPSLANSDGSNVFFLNTVFVERDVNMYSFPWGGPRCYLKRYARVICNIDIVELAKAAEEAGIDFRVILLKRAIGAAVVSASLHRPFGTLVSETRMLALSWSLLKEGIETIDSKFTMEISYEALMNHPKESAAKLADYMGVPLGHSLHVHMESTLTESGTEHPVGDGSKWKEEVDVDQLQFMSDILGL